MIDEVLAALAHELNSALRVRLRVSEDLLVLSPPCEPDGSPAQGMENRLALFVTAMSRSVPFSPLPYLATSAASTSEFELSLVCAACFRACNYGEGLKLLVTITDELAARSMPAGASCSWLPPAVMRLEVTPEVLSLPEWQALWGMHGGRYLPSMLYRVRIVVSR